MIVKESNISGFSVDRIKGLIDRIYPESVIALKLSKWTICPYAEKVITVEADDLLLGVSIIYKNPFLFDQGGLCAFGNLEFIDNKEVAELLFRGIEKCATSLNATQLVGPMNGSTWFDYRLSHPSNSPLFLGENTHPAYYASLIEELGFNSIAKFYSAKDETEFFNFSKLKFTTEIFAKKGMTIRRLSESNFEEDLIQIYSLSNSAFSSNFLFAPIEQEDFLKLYLPLKNYIDFNYSKVVVEGENIIAFLLVIPNHLSPNKEPIIKTVARHPNKKYQGAGGLLINDFKYYATQNENEKCIHAFMHEENDSTLISNKFNGQRIRNYTLYSKTLTK